MNRHSIIIALTARLALLSSISFGGFPTVLPDVRTFVVTTHGWMTNQDFADFFALAQAIPGPNMILMMSFVGWKVWGIPGAIASALATFGPPCVMYFTAYRLWDRLRAASWQRILRAGLVPVTVGLVIASGTVREMRAIVGHKRITCFTALPAELVASWPGVESARRERGRLQITAGNADAIVKRLLAADADFQDLEVHSAGLAEAFTELTQESTQEVAS